MERHDAEPKALIKTVGDQPLRARIEVELFATPLARMVVQPAHERPGEAASAMGFAADEIVHIEGHTPVQMLGDAEPGASHRRAAVLDIQSGRGGNY